MKNLSSRVFATVGVLSCGVFLSMPTASASVIGALLLDGTGADQVTVGASSLSWDGTATVDPASTLTYSGGALDSGTATLQPLPAGVGPGFMTFSSAPVLSFTLLTIGPGDPVCSSTVTTDCSAFAGSPITLTAEAGGTLVGLSLGGVVIDTGGPGDYAWTGLFSTTVTSLAGYTGVITPLEIQAYFGGPSSPNSNMISSTYSGTFFATIVPEPSSIAIMAMGSGMILFALFRRRKQVR
jgi:hypothetical protein